MVFSVGACKTVELLLAQTGTINLPAHIEPPEMKRNIHNVISDSTTNLEIAQAKKIISWKFLNALLNSAFTEIIFRKNDIFFYISVACGDARIANKYLKVFFSDNMQLYNLEYILDGMFFFSIHIYIKFVRRAHKVVLMELMLWKYSINIEKETFIIEKCKCTFVLTQ